MKKYLLLGLIMSAMASLGSAGASQRLQRAFGTSYQYLSRSFSKFSSSRLSSLRAFQGSKGNYRDQQHKRETSWDLASKKQYGLLGLWGWWLGTTQDGEESLRLHEDFKDFLRNSLRHPDFENSISLKHANMLEAGDGKWVSRLFGKDFFNGKFDHAKTMLSELLSRESRYAADYSVFYHAHYGGFRVVQDFYGSLADLLGNQNNNEENFLYLRDPLDFPQKKRLENPKYATIAQEWHAKNDGIHDCGSFQESQERLSVNVSLFGNLDEKGESTLYYFFHNQSVQNGFMTLVDDLVSNYDFRLDTGYYKKAVKRIEENGHLLQIFIPKDKVDQCSYVSQVNGWPICKCVHECMQYKDLLSLLKLREKKTDWNSYIRRRYNVDSLAPQVRIVLESDITLNPKSGVMIFRHTTAPQKFEQRYQEEMYQHEFKGMTHSMFIEWLERMKTNGVKQKALERIRPTELGQRILRDDPTTKKLMPYAPAIDKELARLRQQ